MWMKDLIYRARTLIKMYEEEGISKDRILLKVYFIDDD